MKKALLISLLISFTSDIFSQIIADHTVVDKYKDIPQYYIDIVKTKLVWIIGMSHSIGYFNGATLLESYDSKFQSTVWLETSPPAYTNSAMRIGREYLQREGVYTNSVGVNNLNSMIGDQAESGNPFNLVCFGWSYQGTWENDPGGTIDPVYRVRWAGSSQSGPEGNLRWGLDSGDQALTGNSVCMDTYLAAIETYNSYCQANGFPTKAIFSTLAVDGDAGTEAGYQRELKSQYIRNYVAAHQGAILFDYADILCYNNSGELNTENWNDGGTLRPHAQIHPDNMKDYDASWNMIDRTSHNPEDHIGEVGALRLGKALWWMLARIEGWNGNISSVVETDDISNDFKIRVSNELIEITSEMHLLPITISLFDLGGNMLANYFTHEVKFTFSSEGLASGIYIINVSGGGTSVSRKLMVTSY